MIYYLLLEAYEFMLDDMQANGENELANQYLEYATHAISKALSNLSDAVFELTTSVKNDEEESD